MSLCGLAIRGVARETDEVSASADGRPSRQAPTQHSITADTTVANLAAWWQTFMGDEGRIDSTRVNEHERVLAHVVLPELGGLRLREVTTSRLDLFLVRLRATSVSRERKTTVVLRAMLGTAVRHDAIAVNPVQQASRLYRDRSDPRSLTPPTSRRSV